MHRLALPLLVVFSLLTPLVAQENIGQRTAELIAPLDDRQALAILRVDTRKLDLKAAVDWFVDAAKASEGERRQLQRNIEQPQQMAERFRMAGGQEIVWLVLPATGADNREPVELAGVASAAPGKGEEVANAFKISLPPRTETSVQGDRVYFARAERLKNLDLKAKPSSEVAKAFAEVGEGTVQVAIVPSEDTRRVMRELLPKLPEEFGGFSGADLDRWLGWAALSVDLPPRPRLQLRVQAQSDDAAKSLQQVAAKLLERAGQAREVREFLPEFDRLRTILTPKAQGEQVTLSIGDKAGEIEQIVPLITRPLQAARGAATRSQLMNQFKQIGLAMHNYHDTHRRFPPQASHSKDGKKLLSWRVHILPYVEQVDLYKQFHLDEPWDSEHNRKLIEKMPSVYANPRQPGVKEGHTTLVVPVGDKTVFGGSEGMKIQEITDGTSNTVLVIESDAEHAVPWTKPDDLEFDPKMPLKGIFVDQAKQILLLFGDGSVQAIPANRAKDLLPPLFTASGGEVVER